MLDKHPKTQKRNKKKKSQKHKQTSEKMQQLDHSQMKSKVIWQKACDLAALLARAMKLQSLCCPPLDCFLESSMDCCHFFFGGLCGKFCVRFMI
jgi:hypothetical protein